MNLKIKKAGIIVSIIIVIIILVDLLFNFSGVLNERFQTRTPVNTTGTLDNATGTLDNATGTLDNATGTPVNTTGTPENAEKQQEQELKDRINRAKASNVNNTDDKEIKSIESEYSSERFNVISVDGTNTTINIKTSSFNSLAMAMTEDINENSLVRSATSLRSSSQQFTLVKINNFEEVEKFMKELNIGTYFPAPVEFPYYYILAPGTKDKVLHVGDDDLSLQKASNRTNQIFHVHNTPYLGLDNKPNDQIDIKIKLDQESINTIIDRLGFADNNINNTAADFEMDLDKDCNLDNWIPRDAVNSMCPLCDPDLID